MIKKVLITGGSGYFGSVLISKLLDKGYECINFDISDPDEIDSKIKFIKGDIRDIQDVLKACDGVDIVHHNVAQVPLAKNDALFRSVNYEGVENIMRASLQNNVKKVVYTSSSAVFGVPKSNPVDDKAVPQPGESYGQAKYDGEKICHSYINKGLDISIVRPRTIMGHGRLGIFQILFEWIYKGQNVPVFNGGSNIYQFIHADDLADACILIGEKKDPDIFNCGASEFGSMKEVLDQICQYANTGSKVRSVPMRPTIFGMNVFSKLGMSPLGPYHALMYGNSMYFDITKAQTVLDWNPKYSNFEMFRDSYDWYIKNRDNVLNNNGTSLHKSTVQQGVLSLVGKFL